MKRRMFLVLAVLGLAAVVALGRPPQAGLLAGEPGGGSGESGKVAPAKPESPSAAPPAAKAEKPEPADNSYCYACHVNYQEEKLTVAHQPVGVGCETCHGVSIEHSGDEDNITPPDRLFAKADIDPYCITCHAKEKLLKREEHRIFMQDPLPDETCNTCHAEKHKLAVRTRVWDKKTRKLLDDDGVRMMEAKKEK